MALHRDTCKPEWSLNVIFGLLLGVEDTADGKQQRTNRQKNNESNENNRFVGQFLFVICTGTVSSRQRKNPYLYLNW